MEVVVPDQFKRLFEVSDQRPILKIPHPSLRKVAAPVSKITSRHKILFENMARFMRDANGIGLAGPQIGIMERVIVISPDRRPMVLINPEIIEKEGVQLGEEGCLSIPGLYGEVSRSAWVKVKALNKKGDEVTTEFEDLAARVVQHEVDHLEGILFIDKADPASLYWRMPDGEDEI